MAAKRGLLPLEDGETSSFPFAFSDTSREEQRHLVTGRWGGHTGSCMALTDTMVEGYRYSRPSLSSPIPHLWGWGGGPCAIATQVCSSRLYLAFDDSLGSESAASSMVFVGVELLLAKSLWWLVFVLLGWPSLLLLCLETKSFSWASLVAPLVSLV